MSFPSYWGETLKSWMVNLTHVFKKKSKKKKIFLIECKFSKFQPKRHKVHVAHFQSSESNQTHNRISAKKTVSCHNHRHLEQEPSKFSNDLEQLFFSFSSSSSLRLTLKKLLWVVPPDSCEEWLWQSRCVSRASWELRQLSMRKTQCGSYFRTHITINFEIVTVWVAPTDSCGDKLILIVDAWVSP